MSTPALCSRTHGSASKLHLSTGETNANLGSERGETPNKKGRMSVKLCNYQQVNYSYRDSSWHTAPGTATAHESEQKGIFNC